MTMHPFGRRRVFPKDSVLFPPGDATHNLHRIEEGVVRQCLYLSDGQRLVAGFAFPGELVGLIGGHQMLTAEAAAPVLTFEWAVDPEDEHDQRAKMLVLALHQAYLALALRSRRHARARVAAFLFDLAERRLGSEFRLPIPLADLADHLGLRLHTVSRIFTELRGDGVLRQARGRLFTITQIDRLREIANEAPTIRSNGHSSASSPGITQ